MDNAMRWRAVSTSATFARRAAGFTRTIGFRVRYVLVGHKKNMPVGMFFTTGVGVYLISYD